MKKCKLITLCLLFVIVGYATVSFANTGKSKLCDDIGYLSTSCSDVKILEPKYKDIDVAKKDAESSKTYTNVVNNNPTYIINKEGKQEEIIVKSWFEEE